MAEVGLGLVTELMHSGGASPCWLALCCTPCIMLFLILPLHFAAAAATAPRPRLPPPILSQLHLRQVCERLGCVQRGGGDQQGVCAGEQHGASLCSPALWW